MLQLFTVTLGVVLGAAGLSQAAAASHPSSNIILRKLASPRFFGAAANTTFLFNDANYTKVISTQVGCFARADLQCILKILLQFSIFTPENESEHI